MCDQLKIYTYFCDTNIANISELGEITRKNSCFGQQN